RGGAPTPGEPVRDDRSKATDRLASGGGRSRPTRLSVHGSQGRGVRFVEARTLAASSRNVRPWALCRWRRTFRVGQTGRIGGWRGVGSGFGNPPVPRDAAGLG